MNNNNCIENLTYKEILEQLSRNSLSKTIKRYLSYYEKACSILQAKGIDPRILKSRITPEDLKQFELIGLSKSKVSMLLNVSVSTLKRVQRLGNVQITPEEWAEEKDCLQQCINYLRIKGYTQEDIAYILCTYVEKLRREFDVSTEFPVVTSKSNAEKLMLRRAYMLGNLYNIMFTDDDGGVVL